MEMEHVTIIPITHLDRPRKRPRFGWDVPQIRYIAKWEKAPLVRFWNAGTEKERKWLPSKLYVASRNIGKQP
uniref:Uncharacterized protein n=1 Tax=Salix viminalis TaxID=40686 RepID=A0A6N2K4J7_SALVM